MSDSYLNNMGLAMSYVQPIYYSDPSYGGAIYGGETYRDRERMQRLYDQQEADIARNRAMEADRQLSEGISRSESQAFLRSIS